MDRNERYYFKTNVLLKSIIGKDLINNDNIAILELVKNSFDANSKEVNIIFKNLKENDDNVVENYSEKTSKIIIQDFGNGMSETDLREKWLNIAYSEKKGKKEEFGRTLAGAKGIGRFSCDRLGRFLDLYTRKEDSEIFHLYIDWEDFEIDNRVDLEIQKIDVIVSRISPNDFKSKTGLLLFNHGTIIEISRLRSEWTYLEERSRKGNYWNKDKLLDLRNYLEKLINPNQAFKKDYFNVNLIAEEFLIDDQNSPENKRVNGEIRNRIFEKLDFTTTSIESEISHDGYQITTTLQDKGRVVFKLVEKNHYHPNLKNIKIVLYFLNRYAKIYFARQTGVRSVDFGSIFLFLNGFRIPPYGDEGNDWLGLEVRKVQNWARNLGTRELIGRLEITDLDNKFRVVSSREGLVKDSNYELLTKGFFFKTLRRLERFVVEGLDWDRITSIHKEEDDDSLNIRDFEKKVKSPGWQFSAEDEIYWESQKDKDKRIISILYSIINVKPEDILELYVNSELIENLIEEDREKFEQVFADFQKFDSSILDTSTKNAIDKVKDLLKRKEKELQAAEKRYKTTKQQKEQAEKRAKEAEEEAQREKDERQRTEKRLEQTVSQNIFLKSLATRDFDQMVSILHHVGISANTIDIYLKRVIKRIKSGASVDLTDFEDIIEKISYENRKILSFANFATKANFKVQEEIVDEDVVQFIIHYLCNVKEHYEFDIHIDSPKEIKFVKRLKPIDLIIILDNFLSNSKKHHAKDFYVTMNTDDEELEIKFRDNGTGLSKKILEPKSIFEKGVTTTLTGSGLGLFHVKEIVESMNGYVNVNSNIEKGIEFIVRMKR